MVLFALSLQGQVEKYGSYVGIAAFFGLAVLSLLYFAQAREVKRLREWAGRAPERAREVEERALAAAEAARSRPAPAPAQVAQPQAQPVAAATAGGRSGTVGPAVPVAAAGTAVVEQERPVGGEDGEPVAEGPATEQGKPPAPAVSPRADAEDEDGEPGLAERDDEDPRDEADDADTDDTDGEAAGAPGERPAAAPTNGAPPAGAERPVLPRPSTAAGAGAVGAAAAAGAAGAAASPAATGNAPRGPGQTVAAGTGQNRPAPAMPLRAGMPSASPRRAATMPPRRPLPPAAAESSGHGGRRWAILGGVAAVIAALGVFAATQLLHKNSASPKQAATPSPAATAGATAGAAPTSRADTTVAVLNGTTIGGLAANTADKLASSGYKRGSTGDFTDQQRSSSTIFYRREARRQARDISRELHISDLRPMDAETQALAGDRAQVAVVVGSDKAP